MSTQYTLIDNPTEQRYEFDINGQKAVAEYLLQPGVIILTHVGVPSALEGQGIGAALVAAVLEQVRERGLKLVPQCTFVAQYIRRHPEWEELLCK